MPARWKAIMKFLCLHSWELQLACSQQTLMIYMSTHFQINTTFFQIVICLFHFQVTVTKRKQLLHHYSQKLTSILTNTRLEKVVLVENLHAIQLHKNAPQHSFCSNYFPNCSSICRDFGTLVPRK